MQFNCRRAPTIGFCTIAMFALVSCRPSQTSFSPSTEVSEGVVSGSTVKSQPVNIIVITLDTVRADHLHCYGYGKIKTPNIDELAKNGVLFEKAVTQTPLTAPSHASIFTGLNPNVHHVRDTGGFALQPSSATLAAVLQKYGWDTAGFISAPVLDRQFGFNQGFSTYDDQIPETVDKGSGQTVTTRPANVTVDHAISWLNAQFGKPYFIWVHLYDAHQPYNPPAQFRKQYSKNLYDAEIAFEDQQLGRLLDAVKQKSPGGKTIIMVLSDHGEGLGQHGEDGHGIFLYDSTVRIAWIMAGPGIPAGVRVQQQAREIDALATVLNLLGGKPSSLVQGTTMVPAFSGKSVPSTFSYEETLYPKINMGWSELRGIHTPHWMYIRAPKPELYNLDQDPNELNNVIASQPKEYRELEAQLKQLSNLGASNTETIATNHMDQQTMDQLKSLGYVGGSSNSNFELNGKGADAKDMLDVLRISDTVTGPGSEKLSPAHKIDLLKLAIKQDPTNPYLYCTMGDLYQKIGNNDLALQTYLAALHEGIQDEMLFSRLGDIYLRTGHPQEAILFFQQAIKLDPLDGQNQCNLANAYMHSGQRAEAEQIFRYVVTFQPNPQAYNGLGVMALNRHDFSSARSYFEHAIQLKADDPEAQYNLGLSCAQIPDLPCAQTAFQAFLVKAPPAYKNLIPQAEYNLGMACIQAHNVPCARTTLKKFLSNATAMNSNVMAQARAALASMH